MTGAELSPAWTLVVGAALVPLLRGALRGAWTVLLPLAGLAQLWFLVPGEYGQVAFLGQELLLVRVDRWSTLFGAVFLIAALLNSIYALHVRDAVQPTAGLAYAGAAIGAVFAGDLLTLFVFWELTAITSVFLIWARRTERSFAAGMRYLVIHLTSGMLLLFGALQQLNATGSLRFEHIGLDGPGGLLIFLGFGIKCAFPLLHNWLQDAYPEATESGTVMLSAFTTKLAVYALARGFAGQPELIWIGATMAAFPIFYAVIENDLRRVLAYSLNNQLGFMVVGIGVGTELALNGTAAHAFSHIIYKGLLFMSMGAVLLRTGTVKASELGGLYKSMPWTTGFCIVGAASIAAFPLFSGFVSKSMILSAAGGEGHLVAFLVLLFASAAMFHPDAKVPFFAFFGRDSGRRCEEAPWNMLVAMGLAAALCIGIGVFPQPLYAMLPFAVDYEPYTGSHVLSQLQLLLFSGLVFAVLLRAGLYPRQRPSVNLDFDWTYRRLAPAVVRGISRAVSAFLDLLARGRSRLLRSIVAAARRLHQPGGLLARTWPSGTSALWMMVLLLGLLLTGYLA